MNVKLLLSSVGLAALALSVFAASAPKLEEEAEMKESDGKHDAAVRLFSQAADQRMKDADVIVVKGEKEDVTEAVEARQQFEFKNKIDYKAADGGERVQYPSVKKLEEAGQKAAEAVSKKDKPAAKPVKRSAAETEKANGQLFLI